MFTITAIERLRRRGLEVELFCLHDSKIHQEAGKQSIRVHTIRRAGYIHPLEILHLRNILKSNNFDIIHTQASKDLWVLIPAASLLGKKLPVILTKQVGSYIIKKDILHRWLYHRVTYALAISQVIKKNLIDTCPLKEEQVLLLHNGIDMQRFNPRSADRIPVRKSLGIQEDEIVLGMMARFSPGKGHEEFLQAAHELNKKYKNLIYLIVGTASKGEDTYADGIRQMAEDLKLENAVFAGFRPDTENMYAAMDIFVFPSHSEALGIALIEAMAMEKACVCSNSDGVLDLAQDKQNALLFENKNWNDLYNKTGQLILDPQLRTRLGGAARKFVEKKFDIEFLTDKVIEIYKQALRITAER